MFRRRIIFRPRMCGKSWLLERYLEEFRPEPIHHVIKIAVNEPKEQRPEPKFAKGQMTDKGKINKLLWCTNINRWNSPTWIYRMAEPIWYRESELTAVPSIEVTLFECFWNGSKTEVRTETHPDIIYNKDKLAEHYFREGKCAILITKDGKSERRYCPEIEAIKHDPHYSFICWTGWHKSFESIAVHIQQAINHPKFLVESNGVKMRAYRMKNGRVQVEIGKDNYWKFQDRDEFLTALGFNPDNIMPAILRGKG